MARAKIKYLSNSELLFEINESKKTYCYFIDDAYANFDYIVESVSELEDGDTLQAGKEARAKRLNILVKRDAILHEEDPSLLIKLTANDIDIVDVVFRIMTYEHIPLIENIDKIKYVKIPFPPFKHYIMYEDQPKEVGRSHWVDSLENGHFTATAGRISDRLTGMYYKLILRYSTKPNWRGYSYLDEMLANALLQFAAMALKFNEAKSANPFAWYTTVASNSFKGTLKIEKKNQNIRDELLIQSGSTPSFSRQMAEIDSQAEMREQWEKANKKLKGR